MSANKGNRLKSILGRYFLLFSVLSMIVGLSVYGVLSYNSFKGNSQANIINLRDEQTRFLDTWLMERAMIINNISFCTKVKNQDLAGMKELFKEQLGITTGFENLAFANKNGDVLLYGQVENIKVNIADREYFKLAQQGKSSLSELLVSRITGNSTVIVSSPVISNQGEISGVVFAPLKWSKILQIITFHRLGDTGETYIVDKEGKVFSSNPNKTRGQLDTKAAVIQKLKGRDNGCDEYLDDRGSKVFGAYRDLHNFDWGILMEIDKAELFDDFRKDLGLAILLCLFILGTIIYPFSRYLTRKIVLPLEQMTMSIREFAQICEKGNNHLKNEDIFYEEVADVKKSFCEIDQKIKNIYALMQSQIFYEPLTGLANKRYFLLRAQEVIDLAYRKHTCCSLISFSIDKFGQLKKELKPEDCDRLLVHIADILGKTTRLSDILGKQDEENFALILQDTDADEAWQIAENFRKEVEENPVEVNYRALSLTVSIGIAVFMGDPGKYANSLDLLENLFEESGKMRLEAQEKGGNRIEIACL